MYILARQTQYTNELPLPPFRLQMISPLLPLQSFPALTPLLSLLHSQADRNTEMGGADRHRQTHSC